MRFYEDDDIMLPDNQEDLIKMIEELAKEAIADFSMTKEEHEAKYGVSPLSSPKPKPIKASGRRPSKPEVTVPVYDMHTFDMHWMLHHLDLFRDGISLKEYVRRARRDGSDITMKWYSAVEKYRFTEEGIQRMGRQQLGYKSRHMLEQLDVYVDHYQRELEKREQQFAGTWKPEFSWEKPIEGDTPEQLKADKKLFKKFQEEYGIINSYYPELPDIASAIYLTQVLDRNGKDFPETPWRNLRGKFEDADVDYDTPIKELVKIGLLDKKIAEDCKKQGFTKASDLLKNTPLQYHALVEENCTDDPGIINPLMDAEDARRPKLGDAYPPLTLASLNFARAVIADLLWGEL